MSEALAAFQVNEIKAPQALRVFRRFQHGVTIENHSPKQKSFSKTSPLSSVPPTLRLVSVGPHPYSMLHSRALGW